MSVGGEAIYRPEENSRMQDGLLGSLTVIDTSGFLIITAIVIILAFGVGLTIYVRGRYAAIARDLQRNADSLPQSASPLLNAIAREVRAAVTRHPGEVNTQAIVEHKVQTELGALLSWGSSALSMV
jgi:hypothetical protein